MKRLNDGIQLCLKMNDGGSRELAEKILSDEEHHIDWLEAQLHAISEMGIQNYLAQQLKKDEDSNSNTPFAPFAGVAIGRSDYNEWRLRVLAKTKRIAVRYNETALTFRASADASRTERWPSG